MVLLQASASEASLSRRARPRRDPAHRWVQPIISPLSMPAAAPSPDASFARFVSEALLCDAAEALELAVRVAPLLVPGAQWAHFLVLSEGENASLTLACSSSTSHEPGSVSVPVSDGLVGYVARSGVPAVETDASLHLARGATLLTFLASEYLTLNSRDHSQDLLSLASTSMQIAYCRVRFQMLSGSPQQSS